VAIYTMAGWCLSCIPEAQAWAKLYSEYHQRGVDVLLLSVDPSDMPTTLANFSNLAGREVATWPWAIDKDQPRRDYSTCAHSTRRLSSSGGGGSPTWTTGRRRLIGYSGYSISCCRGNRE